jgi:hypothetical protein
MSAQYRNVSNDTVYDWVHGKNVEPDGVLEVLDHNRPLYENHPVFREVGATPTAPVVTAPQVSSSDADENQEAPAE